MSLTSTVVWQPIETIPHGERIFVADLLDGILVTAIAELEYGETIIYAAGRPATTTKWWTHWAAFPELPPFKAATAKAKDWRPEKFKKLKALGEKE
jgi:hypothetical protein